MNAFIVLALIGAAVAAPESDPNLVYTDGQFHTNYANLAKGIHAGRAYAGGALYNSFPAYQYGSVQYASPFVHALGKREAESDADSQYYTAGVYPSLYNTAGLYRPYSALSTAYSGLYSPYAGFAGHRYIAKRDAEADSDADSQWALTSGIYAPTAYNTAGLYRPYGLSTYSNIYSPYTTYSGHRYIAKRDADADADAQFYTAGLYRPQAYSAGIYRPSVYSSSIYRSSPYFGRYYY